LRNPEQIVKAMKLLEAAGETTSLGKL